MSYTVVVYEMIYPITMVQPGTIEFKYRKDSLNGEMVNGRFSFLINKEPILIDNDYH